MPITMICPTCSKVATAPDSAAGCRGKCAHCGGAIHVPQPGAKLCKICGIDVSESTRVKDAQGFYFCEACYAQAKAAAKGNAAAPREKAASASIVPNAIPLPAEAILSDDDDLTLPGVAAEAPPPAVGAVAASVLPKHCPKCATPVIKNSKYCVGCHCDMTEMDVSGGQKLSADEKVGEWIGKSIKWGVIALGAAGLIFFVWLVIGTLRMPKGPFDDYPTSREQVVKDYIAAIARGDKAGYDDAFRLVSFRVRMTPNDKEWVIYHAIYARMNKDFTAKYGADWIKKMSVEPDDMPFFADGDAAYAVVLGKDRYIVTVEAERPLNQQVQTLLLKVPDTPHDEDGKNHFGICEVEGYLAHARPKITLPERGNAHPDGGPLPGDGN